MPFAFGYLSLAQDQSGCHNDAIRRVGMHLEVYRAQSDGICDQDKFE